MKLSDDAVPKIIPSMNILAKEKGYDKIFAKIPAHLAYHFTRAGFRKEASVPNFYNGNEDVFFMAKYFSEDRVHCSNLKEIHDVVTKAQTHKIKTYNGLTHKQKYEQHLLDIEAQFSFRIALSDDSQDIANLYQKTFKTYPFPIFDPEYIRNTMMENVIYFTLWDKDKLIAVAATEIYKDDSNVEMTDFSTHSDYGGKGLAKYLLYKMEVEMHNQGIKTFYTIARALSIGMNFVFAGNGYTYGGTLINNTSIGESIESMNIWYK